MTRTLLLALAASLIFPPMAARAVGEEAQAQYVQIAEIEIEPAQMEAYKSAVKEHIETAVRVEPGVLVLYAVTEEDNPTRVRVFEIYRDTAAYKSHLESVHFKQYKSTTATMVRSLKLVLATPVALGAKPAGAAQ